MLRPFRGCGIARPHMHIFCCRILEGPYLELVAATQDLYAGQSFAHMTWDEFKAFLRKSLRESNAFVGHVWSKLRGDAQPQLEEIQD